MATLGEYLQTWKLKLSTTKTVSAVFHLNNKEAKRELKVSFNNETLPFCSEPKYLGVTLDRSLTYRRHLESHRKKLTSRVALLRRLAGSCWGVGATTLRTATWALVHSTAEYCAPVWCRSAHTRLIDPTINDALRIVTGWLRPTPADNLPILAGIQSAELRRRGATLSLGRRAMELGHLLHSALIDDPPTAPHVCCCCQKNWWVVVRRVQMGVSIWGAVQLHPMDGTLTNGKATSNNSDHPTQ